MCIYTHHFVYETSHPNGKFYRGRHSTTNLNDGYVGSGKWVKSIHDQSSLVVKILEYASSYEDLLIMEKKYISEVIGTENNMNFNNEASGWPSGKLNPSKSVERRKKSSELKKGKSYEELYGEKKAAEISQKIRESRTGKPGNPCWSKGLTKETSPILNKMSESISKTLLLMNSKLTIEERSIKYGNVEELNGFYGKHHSQISKHKMSTAHISQRSKSINCEKCGAMVDKQNYTKHHGPQCGKGAIGVRGKRWFKNNEQSYFLYPDDPLIAELKLILGRANKNLGIKKIVNL